MTRSFRHSCESIIYTHQARTVFRGCKKSPDDLGIELTKGFEFTWSSFCSTATTHQGVMQTFLGQSGPRTLMTIKMVESSGRDVRD